MRFSLLLALPLITGCIGYPHLHMLKKKGRAFVEDGQPVRLQAALVKDCDTVRGGEISKTIKTKDLVTDAKGNYSVRFIRPVTNWWSWSGARCVSRIQMFVCRPTCRPVDDVDLEVLGK